MPERFEMVVPCKALYKCSALPFTLAQPVTIVADSELQQQYARWDNLTRHLQTGDDMCWQKCPKRSQHTLCDACRDESVWTLCEDELITTSLDSDSTTLMYKFRHQAETSMKLVLSTVSKPADISDKRKRTDVFSIDYTRVVITAGQRRSPLNDQYDRQIGISAVGLRDFCFPDPISWRQLSSRHPW